MATTEVGYARQKQYQSGRTRRHSVTKDDDGRWVTRCTGKPATREYKGWTTTVNCKACRAVLGVDREDDE